MIVSLVHFFVFQVETKAYTQLIHKENLIKYNYLIKRLLQSKLYTVFLGISVDKWLFMHSLSTAFLTSLEFQYKNAQNCGLLLQYSHFYPQLYT